MIGKTLLIVLILVLPLIGVAKDSLRIEFSPIGGFYTGAQTIKLTSPVKGASLFYTTDGSIPSSGSRKYNGSISISKSVVIRVKAYIKGKPTNTFTNSYFIDRKFTLPVVSIATNAANFFSPDRGIYVKGCCADSMQPYQGANFWKGWERPINIEYYEADGTQGINQRAGIRIFGGFSKGLPMKSLAIISRKKYEKKYFKYSIFKEKKKIKKYKTFILRNSGGDFNKTHFRDALITQISKPSGVPIQAYQPVAVFINGEYWGIHNAREKINEYYFKYNNGADVDSIDIMKHRNDLQVGNRKAYKALLTYMRNTTFLENQEIEELDKKMNIDNYIDHHLAQVYCDNGDAGGNIRYWRPQKDNARWNWVLFDTDLSMGIGNWKAYKVNTLNEMTVKSNEKWPNPAWSTFIIRKLLENDSIKQLYIARCANYLNTIYSEKTVVDKIDEIQNLISTEMDFHRVKWGGKKEVWERNVQVLRDYALHRPHYMRIHMQTEFGLFDTVNIGLDANVEGLENLTLNGMNIKGEFKGVYFKQFPLNLKVKVKTGYVFKGWKGADKEGEKITLFPKGDLTLVPIIEKRVQSENWNKIVFNELSFAQDTTKPEQDWIELYNPSKESVELKGWTLQISYVKKKVKIIDFTINPEEYLVLAEDKEALLLQNVNLDGRRVIDCSKLNLKKSGFVLFLLDDDKNIVDSIQVSKQKGTKALSLIDPNKNSHNVSSWESSETTPNQINPTEKKRIESTNGKNLIIYISGLALFFLGVVLLITHRLRKKRMKVA